MSQFRRLSILAGCLFPSPHSGILFLSEWVDSEWLTEKVEFPSPHSGILFLYGYTVINDIRCAMFPSPHSGILFL